MATITASMVNELRKMSGAGMMDCKKALESTNGNLEEAFQLMRKQGQAKAEKKSGRTAAEGIIAIKIFPNRKQGVIVEYNCETDFVARDENFKQFCARVTELALDNQVKEVNALAELPYNDELGTIEHARQTLIGKIGENIQIRRLVFINTTGILCDYIHNGKIGVVVELLGGSTELGRDVAMHIAASNPQVVKPDQVPKELIEKEKEIFTAQAVASDKTPEIAARMVDGRIKKFLDEVSLLGQSYVKDPNLSINQLLKQESAEVLSFIRFEVGEGIEKKIDNFAEEVMAQVRASE